MKSTKKVNQPKVYQDKDSHIIDMPINEKQKESFFYQVYKVATPFIDRSIVDVESKIGAQNATQETSKKEGTSYLYNLYKAATPWINREKVDKESNLGFENKPRVL